MHSHFTLLMLVALCLYLIIPLYGSADGLTLYRLEDYIASIYQRHRFSADQNLASIRVALEEAYAAPLNLHQATKEDLEALGILSDKQIEKYFSHIASTGPLYTRYELQAIPEFDLETIALLLPFIYVPTSAQPTILPLSSHTKNACLFRYVFPMDSATDDSKRYALLGRKEQAMLQFALKPYGGIDIGITTRKQSGESFDWNHATHQYGCHIWSLFCLISDKKYFRKMIIGDYQVGYGEGLLLHAGYSGTQDDDTPFMIGSPTIGIRPYKGIRRIGLRGVAITSVFQPFNIEITAFYSLQNLDGKLEFDEANMPYISRINPTGKYHTAQALSNKGLLQEQAFGCTIVKQDSQQQNTLGFNFLTHYYDMPIIPPKHNINPYLFEGRYASTTSLFGRFLLHNCLLFGESAISYPNASHKSAQFASIAGILISLSRYIDGAAALYYYGKGFYAPYGYGFKCYKSEQANERGYYIGLIFKPMLSWQLAASGHFFATLRAKPRLDRASNGAIFLLRSTYIWLRTTRFLLQYKYSIKPKNSLKNKKNKDINQANLIDLAIQNRIKAKFSHQCTPIWSSYLEWQYARHQLPNDMTSGYALSHGHKWRRQGWNFSCQITYFNARSYMARLYFYALDLPYSGITFQPYYGHGIGGSLVVTWTAMPHLQLTGKYRRKYLFKAALPYLNSKQQADGHDHQLFSIQIKASF